ncbi:MAG TPA: ATP-binding protein [Actinomycetota bacterium]|nr:ATP-binding protein [Actinomycetota bacterium]
MTAAVAVGSFALPYFPKEGGHRPGWFQLYVAGLVLQWTLLSVAVAMGPWKAGRGEPTIARRRMRVLASGSAGLALIMVISGATPGGRQMAVTLATQLLSLCAATLFYLGFVPPPMLRRVWRHTEDEALRGAVAKLMTAKTVEDVAGTLIPTIPGLVGGRAAALIDGRGRLLGSFGLSPRLDSDLSTLASGGDLPDGELRPGLFAIRMRSGSLLVWASAFTPYFGDDDMEFLRYLADLADLALERCELFARERSFIANASHELRTPLTTISGMAGILTETWKDMPSAMIDECLNAINRQGDRVRDLVRTLLDLSTIENDACEPDGRLEVVSLTAVGRGALEVAPPPPGRFVDMDIREGMTAVADPMGLERAITNLLVNAYRYGGPLVRVEGRAVDREVVLTVSDNGDGVPADLVPHLFDPFTRGAGTGGITGSGLGLAITQRLIENFGGRIGYEPGRPRGARSPCTSGLPHEAPGAGRRGRPRHRPHDVGEPATGGTRGDDGLHGRGCLTKLAEERPQVLVLDLGLPGIGGHEVLRRVRADHSLRGLPVVVVSAHVAPPTISEMTSLGCDRYLTKPFDPRKLVRAVGGLPVALGTGASPAGVQG